MSNDSENWKLLQDLFHLAEETPEADRERVLTERCPDGAIRRRAMEIFFSASLTEEAHTSKDSVLIGRRFGPYKLIRHIGSGGIGAVYLAERMLGGSPQRSALKLLAPHAAGSSFVERFHREQHILASLEHPNITRLLDAGLTETGEPYLVMEYVDGLHIDSYCDGRKLSIEARLQLFLRVCDAVAYAHRNLIVHLDLKPSNILVTADGTVKLLDFGTSKLIQPDSMLTTTIMATPAYASPEQLRNEPVTTACDIYSLGAILFELLSGRRPNSESSMAAMIERAMREQEPERLSDAVSAKAAENRGLSETRLRQMLTGDLSTIVAKCLSPRPENRYASVDALSKDVEYFVEGRPILARPLTTRYRLGKFIRRHRAGVAVTVLVTLLVVTSFSYAEWRQRQAILEGRRAEHMQTFMYALFSIANSNYIGKATMSVNEFLLLGVKILPNYIHDRADLRTAELSLAESLLHNSDNPDAQMVLAQVEKTAQADGDISAETESTALLGDIAFRQGNHDQGKLLTLRALQLSRRPGVAPAARVNAKIIYSVNREVNGMASDENIQLLEQAIEEAKTSNLPPGQVSQAVFDLGRAMQIRGRLEEAIPLFRQALELDRQDPTYACTSIQPEGELGHIEMAQGRYSESLADNQRAYDTAIRCFGEDTRESLYQERYVAMDLVWLGRGAEAARMMEKAIQTERTLDKGARGGYLANALYVLSLAEESVGHPEEAEKAVKEEMEMTKGKLDPKSKGWGTMYLLYARALADEHRDKEALQYAEMADRILGPIPNGTYQDKIQASQAHQLFLSLQARSTAQGRQIGQSSLVGKY